MHGKCEVVLESTYNERWLVVKSELLPDLLEVILAGRMDGRVKVPSFVLVIE